MSETAAASATSPASRRTHWSVEVGLWLAFGALLAWGIVRQESAAVTFGAYLFLYPIAIVLHEAAHAVVGLLTGAEVMRVKLGGTINPQGAPLLRVRIGLVPWEIYGVPRTGSVWTRRYVEEGYRLRSAWTTAAGPAVSLLAAVVPVVIVDDREIAPVWSGIAFGWAMANGAIFIGTIYPRTDWRSGLDSDGRSLLKLWRYDADTVRQFVAWNRFEKEWGREIGEIDRLPLPELRAAHEAAPENGLLLLRLLARLFHENDPEAATLVAKLSGHPAAVVEMGLMHLDHVLTVYLLQGTARQHPQADALSRALVELSDTASTRGTRGSILIDLGQYDEGIAMLERVLQETESRNDRIFSHVHLALAAEAGGNREKAREHALAACALDGYHASLRRVEHLLAGASA